MQRASEFNLGRSRGDKIENINNYGVIKSHYGRLFNAEVFLERVIST